MDNKVIFFLAIAKEITLCYTDLIGGVAHLGERLNGIQEVVGSIPIISTKKDQVVSVVP